MLQCAVDDVNDLVQGIQVEGSRILESSSSVEGHIGIVEGKYLALFTNFINMKDHMMDLKDYNEGEAGRLNRELHTQERNFKVANKEREEWRVDAAKKTVKVECLEEWKREERNKCTNLEQDLHITKEERNRIMVERDKVRDLLASSLAENKELKSRNQKLEEERDEVIRRINKFNILEKLYFCGRIAYIFQPETKSNRTSI